MIDDMSEQMQPYNIALNPHLASLLDAAVASVACDSAIGSYEMSRIACGHMATERSRRSTSRTR